MNGEKIYEAKVEEEESEGELGVVESFKELWLDRERLQLACSAMEGKLAACLTPSYPFKPPDQSLPRGNNSLPLPDLLLGHSFSLHSALARWKEEEQAQAMIMIIMIIIRCKEEQARAMAEMRRDRAQYLGLPKHIRPPLSLSQASGPFHMGNMRHALR